jgi:glycosyltransferase involved in cell wall biosynthesis
MGESIKVASIHQLVHTLSYGDAISSEVLALDRAWRELGCVSEIVALHTHPRYQGKTKHLEWAEGQSPDTLVLHYSLGSPLNDLYRVSNATERVLIYHNITPPHWFRSVNPRVCRNIEAGIRDLEELCRLSDRIIADSPYNASEIEAFGLSAEVLPLPIDPSRWTVSANPGIAQMLRADPRPHLLHVGRIAPNKRLEDLIKLLFVLHTAFQKKAVLWLVGIDTDTELYGFALKRMAREFGLEDYVRFTGGLTDEEVRSFYENSSLYLCMSEHEGYCYPVVEAMHFGLPVVAYNAGAIATTIGEGGLIVDTKDPGLLGALVAELLDDAELRRDMIKAGRTQVAAASFERFRENVGSLFRRGMGRRAQLDTATEVAR